MTNLCPNNIYQTLESYICYPLGPHILSYLDRTNILNHGQQNIALVGRTVQLENASCHEKSNRTLSELGK